MLTDADTKSDAGFIRFNVGSGLCLSIVRTQISWLSSICRVILPIPLRLFRSLAGSDIAFHLLSSSRSPSAQHVDVGICVDLQCVCVYGLVALQIVRLLANRGARIVAMTTLNAIIISQTAM